MKMTDYKIGDLVQVLISNPKNDNKPEWRDAEVVDVRIIEPDIVTSKKSYPMVVVKVVRTYCNATPRFLNMGGIDVFLENILNFYDRENTEGIIYETNIKLKE